MICLVKADIALQYSDYYSWKHHIFGITSLWEQNGGRYSGNAPSGVNF